MSSNVPEVRQFKRPPRQTRLLVTMGAYTKEKPAWAGIKQKTSKTFKMNSCHKHGKSNVYACSDSDTGEGNCENKAFMVEKFDIRKELEHRQNSSRPITISSTSSSPDHYKWYMGTAERCDSVSSGMSNSSSGSNTSGAQRSSDQHVARNHVTSKILDIELL